MHFNVVNEAESSAAQAGNPCFSLVHQCDRALHRLSHCTSTP